MNKDSAPRAATELFAESYRLSPKQREVLDVLQTFPAGARAVEIAEALDMHVNTARGHLEELVAQDAVRVLTAPAKGRGRPSLIFQTRVPDNQAIAREYITLIELMASMLSREDTDTFADPELRAKARAIGSQWAQVMGITGRARDELDDALAPLIQRLREMGFDPTRSEPAATDTGQVSIALNSCPFIVDGERPSTFVCAVHEGYIQESMGDRHPVELDLKPFRESGACRVNVRHGGGQADRIGA